MKEMGSVFYCVADINEIFAAGAFNQDFIASALNLIRAEGFRPHAKHKQRDRGRNINVVCSHIGVIGSGYS